MEAVNALLTDVLKGNNKAFFQLTDAVNKALAKGERSPLLEAICVYDGWLILNNRYFTLNEFKQRIEGLY